MYLSWCTTDMTERKQTSIWHFVVKARRHRTWLLGGLGTITFPWLFTRQVSFWVGLPILCWKAELSWIVLKKYLEVLMSGSLWFSFRILPKLFCFLFYTKWKTFINCMKIYWPVIFLVWVKRYPLSF